MGRLYTELSKDTPGIELIPTNFKNTAPWFFDILVDGRKELKEYLIKREIGTREFYLPLHSEPAYGCKESFPVAEEIAKKGLWLPPSIKLTDEQIQYICSEIKKYCKKNYQ